MWVGKDPEFGQIENSSFARLVSLEELSQSYQGVVGRANTSFIATFVLPFQIPSFSTKRK
jgi:hypothetical protein